MTNSLRLSIVDEEAEDEEYELNYGEEIDGEGKFDEWWLFVHSFDWFVVCVFTDEEEEDGEDGEEDGEGKIEDMIDAMNLVNQMFSFIFRRGRWRWCVIDEISFFVNVQWLKKS